MDPKSCTAAQKLLFKSIFRLPVFFGFLGYLGINLGLNFLKFLIFPQKWNCNQNAYEKKKILIFFFFFFEKIWGKIFQKNLKKFMQQIWVKYVLFSTKTFFWILTFFSKIQISLPEGRKNQNPTFFFWEKNKKSRSRFFCKNKLFGHPIRKSKRKFFFEILEIDLFFFSKMRKYTLFRKNSTFKNIQVN